MDGQDASWGDINIQGRARNSVEPIGMNLADLKGKVQTVAGLIAPEELGPTLMHEHLLIELNPPSVRAGEYGRHRDRLDVNPCDCFRLNWGQKSAPINLRLSNRQFMVEELSEMRLAGGRSLVELTVGGLEPDPEGLCELAKASGIQIIMGCGHYVHEYQDPTNATRSVEDFAQEMFMQVTEGAWGTSVRAGIIGEIGCQAPWTEQEKRVMRGALLAQERTGAALNVHPGRSALQPFEIVDFARACGAPLDRLILSHIDRTLSNTDDVLRLAETGAIVEFDLFGWETGNYFNNPSFDLPNDAMRLKMVRAMLDRGHLHQVLISHDICTRSRLLKYGGHGYQHIFANVVPMMLRRNFDQKEIDSILVESPKRLLTFQ